MDTRDSNQMSQNPTLCRSGCGFYGNPSNEGLCSKCFKDAVKRKQSAPSPQLSQSSSSMSHSTAGRASPADTSSTFMDTSSFGNVLNTATTTVISPAHEMMTKLEASGNQESSQSNAVTTATDSTTGPTQSTPQIESVQSDSKKTQKKKSNRCHECKAKFGVIGFPCRCGNTFCSVHRYDTEHNCTFDYKEHGAEEIRKNNPQVIGEKVKKI